MLAAAADAVLAASDSKLNVDVDPDTRGVSEQVWAAIERAAAKIHVASAEMIVCQVSASGPNGRQHEL